MAEPLDVVRKTMLELSAIVMNHVVNPEEVERCRKIIAEVKKLDSLSHAAEHDGSGHCLHCGYAVQLSTVHMWPLRY